MTHPPTDAAAIDRPDDGTPVVAMPARGLPTGAIVGLAAIGAALLFLTLDLRRGAGERSLLATSGTATFAAAPPLRLASLPSSGPAPVVTDDRSRPGDAWRATNPMAVRSRYAATQAPAAAAVPPFAAPTRYPMTGPSAPATMPPPYVPGQPFRSGAAQADGDRAADTPLVIDIDRDGAAPRDGAATGPTADPSRPIRATLIANRASLVPEGTMVAATLETPIDSTRPGLIRAVVGEDVRGFDGKRVLIPRGSRLTGEYRADVQSGQRRVLATWSRLVRPDGVAVRIDSPAADRLGGSGIPGRVETNFLQRFATAVLQSALNVGVNLASRSNGSTVIIGPAGGAMTQVLPAPEPRRSILVKAGQPVSVFVAGDLDFSGVPGWR